MDADPLAQWGRQCQLTGAADLSACMGHHSQPGHPEGQRLILVGIATARAASKAAGDPRHRPGAGAAVPGCGCAVRGGGVRTTLMVKAERGLVQR
ncbi:MAG: hypothetical protein R3E56_16925 [Burkholderiaceae bacterium]